MKALQIKAIISDASRISVLIFLVACHPLQSQEPSVVVPQAVEAAFKVKYSDIPRNWQRHDYGYEATFIKNNIKYEAEFSETGEWLETEYYITETYFPPDLLKRIKQKYPQFTITKYEIEITPQGLFYELDITDGETEAELYFDSNGNPAIDSYED